MDLSLENQIRPKGLIRLPMYISIFVASLLMIIRGSVLVWTSPILNKLESLENNPLDRIITEDENGWLTYIVIIGEIVGSLTFGCAAHKFGRKTLLTIVCVPSLLFYVTMTFSKEIWLYYVARTLGGIGIGGVITLLPMYICELADPKIRGKLCVSMGIFKNIGSLLTYCVGPYVPFYWYHLGYSFLPVLSAIFIFFFTSESPYYIMKTDPLKAEEALRELRGKEDVWEEMNGMKLRLEKASKGTLLEVFKSKGAIKALAIGLVLTFLSQLSGHDHMISFTQLMFYQIGDTLSSEVENIILVVFKLFAKFFALILTDKFTRKRQFLISYLGAAFCHLLLGLYLVLQSNGTDISDLQWIPPLTLMCYFIFYDLGISMLTQTMLGEIFPVSVKSIAISLCDVNGNAVGYLSTLLFKQVQDSIGMGYTFLIFGAVALCAVVFIKLIVVETRGKTLEEIQEKLDQ